MFLCTLNKILNFFTNKYFIFIAELVAFATAFYVFRNERLAFPKLKIVNLCGSLKENFLFLRFDVTNPTYNNLKLMYIYAYNSKNDIFIPALFPNEKLETMIKESSLKYIKLINFEPVYIQNGDSQRFDLFFELTKNKISKNEKIILVLETVTEKTKLKIHISELLDLWQS